MNIRKIIWEELEGFKDSSAEDWDWSEGSNDTTLKKTIIEFNPPLNYKTDNDKLQIVFNSLHEGGLKWVSNKSLLDYENVILKSKYKELVNLMIDENTSVSFSSGNNSVITQTLIQRYPDYKVVDGRELFF